MSVLGPEYLSDPMVLLYLFSALLVAGMSTGVFLFERFGGFSRRYLGLSFIMAGWVAALGMTHGAPHAAAEHFWLRVAYLALPFMVPAAYDLALGMAGRDRAWVSRRVVWIAAGLVALINALGPWLVDGLQRLLVEHSLTGTAWVGLGYLVFEITGLMGAVAIVVRSRSGPVMGEAQLERVGLAMAGVIGALPILDYVLAQDPFRAGLLTPLAVLVGGSLAAIVAVRFRVFAPAHTFGTEEVLDTIADAVLVCGPVGRIRSANPAAEGLLARAESQLIGRSIGEVVGRMEDGEWVPWTELGEPAKVELELRRSDDEPIPVQASIEPIRMSGRAVGAVVVARDIRKRLRAQRALEASQRRYSSLFWHNPALLYETDRDGRVVALNPATEAMLGRSTAELRGEYLTEVVAPEDRGLATEVHEGVLSGESREYQLAVETVHQGRRQMRGVSIPIFEGPDVTGVFGVALDVTDQNRVKRELEVQRRYFADLFDSSPEGIVLLDPGTDEVLRVNEEFTRMFGYTSEEVLGRKLTDLIVPDDRLEEGPDLNARARSEGRVRTETVRRRKDGSLLDVSVLARELRIPGEPRQLYGVYRDISERKAAERALQEREEELRHAQRLEAVGKLAGGIAHDFNNLLTVINGRARFALDHVPEDTEIETELKEIEKAGLRAAALTQQLLAYSRRQVLHPKVLDLNAVVRGLRGMLRRLIGEHIAMETGCTEEDARVRADRGQLEQVLVNLVVNARDAMPQGGTLRIETDVLTLQPDDDRLDRWELEPGEFVRLRVADTGVGMDPDTLEHAFDPFFTTKEQGKGTGLGLATVFGIVKQSEGHVTVRSEPGEGTVCDVYLPRCHEAPSSAAAETAEQTRPSCDHGTILLVEDEDAVRDLAVRVLEREGCTVLPAENGVRALEVVAEHGGDIDLVITDLVMPDMGGRELVEELRRSRPELPVLFMSGYDDAMVSEGGDESEFMAKPFTPKTLTRRVAEALRRPAAGDPAG